ncbi:hypothetical protein DL93DRAFT_2037058, partial [Clavulina sp. PMI_390]
VKQALAEEEAGEEISNPEIRDFIRTAIATRSHVIGSDNGRYLYRQEIWGICIKYGNPFIFLTINPADHHDPIAMFLAGEDIDLDNFSPLDGPSSSERSKILASDPFAATEYFHIVIGAVLEHLLGFHVTERSITTTPGVLGHLSAYFGMVE